MTTPERPQRPLLKVAKPMRSSVQSGGSTTWYPPDSAMNDDGGDAALMDMQSEMRRGLGILNDAQGITKNTGDLTKSGAHRLQQQTEQLKRIREKQDVNLKKTDDITKQVRSYHNAAGKVRNLFSREKADTNDYTRKDYKMDKKINKEASKEAKKRSSRGASKQPKGLQGKIIKERSSGVYGHLDDFNQQVDDGLDDILGQLNGIEADAFVAGQEIRKQGVLVKDVTKNVQKTQEGLMQAHMRFEKKTSKKTKE